MVIIKQVSDIIIEPYSENWFGKSRCRQDADRNAAMPGCQTRLTEHDKKTEGGYKLNEFIKMPPGTQAYVIKLFLPKFFPDNILIQNENFNRLFL